MQNLLLSKTPLGKRLIPLSQEEMLEGMKDGSLKRLQGGVYQAIVGGKKIIPEEKSTFVESHKPRRAKKSKSKSKGD